MEKEVNEPGVVAALSAEDNYGYHTHRIEKGVLGEISKIREEYEELIDAYEQEDRIMQLCELSDLVGAIGRYAETLTGGCIGLIDLIGFNEKTARAFEAGKR